MFHRILFEAPDECDAAEHLGQAILTENSGAPTRRCQWPLDFCDVKNGYHLVMTNSLPWKITMLLIDINR